MNDTNIVYAIEISLKPGQNPNHPDGGKFITSQSEDKGHIKIMFNLALSNGANAKIIELQT